MAQDDVGRTPTDSAVYGEQRSYPETPNATVEPSPATIVVTDSEDSTDAGSEAVGTSDRTLTIVGRGIPSSFEITVDGTIDAANASDAADTTVVSGTTIEGTVENGTVEFQFDGDLTDVTFVDRGITGLSPTAAPHVHVDYTASGRSGK